MFDWEDGDRFSFEDSERFEEDSLCSWISEPESLCNNWRGWRRQGNGNGRARDADGCVQSLTELCARTVAAHIPFEVVEQMSPPMPEQLQLRIAFWSFPENEEDIRLYSCLANGNADEFSRGENLYRHKCVHNPLQIGFHLSATVEMTTATKGQNNVAVTFDRGRVTTCNCTCVSTASWCSHVVAVCLYRIHQSTQVKLRAPVSESLSRLHRDQLQKFAQYLISELPQQILPTAQRLIDEILNGSNSDINNVSGAPDPTAGGSVQEETAWWLDEGNLHDNIHKILVKFCVPSPMVFSDVNYLSSTAPPVAAEWTSLLRPLRGREPEGMWNLLAIVREMFKRNDRNAFPLLEIITEECLATEKILVWWVNTKVALHSGSSGHGGKNGVNSNSHGSQYACSSLCDEIVVLWRLAALNPALSPSEREQLGQQFRKWHLQVLEKVSKSKDTGTNVATGTLNKRISDIDIFPGFRPAVEACLLDWKDYPLVGITYPQTSSRYLNHIVCFRHEPPPASISGVPYPRSYSSHSSSKRSAGERRVAISPGSALVELRLERELPRGGPAARNQSSRGRQRSSSASSEGFCDNDPGRDSDSAAGWEGDGGGRAFAPGSFAPHNQVAKSGRGGRRGSSAEESDCSGAPRDVGNSATPAVLTAAADQPATSSGTNDGYEVYMIGTVQPSIEAQAEKSTQDIFTMLRRLEDPLDILFARAEGLHAHGHVREAAELAVHLAQQLLLHPPNFMVDLPLPPPTLPRGGGKRRKPNPVSHQITCMASATLAKCAFLCTVLAENPENTHLAFQVAIFGLEMARPPASTKPLEVKLANQESDLVGLLKRLPLGMAELASIRCKADQMRTNTLRSRGEAMLPLMLASFLFDALVLAAPTKSSGSAVDCAQKHNQDEILGFEAAVAAIGMKANVSEFEHPLLCEATRRQRGELALTLLTHYKDNPEFLARIMDKLLDKEIHQMSKALSLPTYCPGTNSTPRSSQPTQSTAISDVVETPVIYSAVEEGSSMAYDATGTSRVPVPSTSVSASQPTHGIVSGSAVEVIDQAVSKLSLSKSIVGSKKSEGATAVNFCDGDDGETSGWEDYKVWEETFSPDGGKSGGVRVKSCSRKNSASGNWMKPTGPGSDSGSSGNSSDSVVSVSSGDKGGAEVLKPVESPPLFVYRQIPQPTSDTVPPMRPQAQYVKGGRYKGKRAYPTVPNQPSEASAYFMFELAKTVLNKAGGNSNTAALFTPMPNNSQNLRGPHRPLHLCAFQIGLYALGLHNSVSLNWLSRTYSSHVSWITSQAVEIGAAAITFLIDTWEGHLTPQEAAAIADRASRGHDAATVRSAARLSLSCLPHAQALNPNEINRAILQCKEQTNDMLERACLAVEGAAKGGGVYPEVLFSVAHQWYDLYEARMRRPLRAAPHGERMGLVPAREPDGIVGMGLADSVPPPGMIALQQPPPQMGIVSLEQHAQQAMLPSVNSGGMPCALQAMPGYAVSNNQSVSIGPTGLPFPLSYNCIQGLPPGMPCLNPSIPIHMYMQPPGVAFQGSPQGVSQQLMPHPLQYYTPSSLASAMHQGGIVGPMSGPQQNLSTHSMTSSMQQPPLMQNSSMSQGFYTFPFPGLGPGGVSATGYIGGHHQQALMPMVRMQGLSLVQHVQHQPPHHRGAASPPHGQQQVRGLVANQQQVNNSASMHHLWSAYRVGMLALETLAQKVKDDRPQAKYARSPPYGEDVKWLLGVAKQLGTYQMNLFIGLAVKSIASPFILHELALEANQYLARHSSAAPNVLQQQLRSTIQQHLIPTCQHMFVQYAQWKICYITPPEYDEFVSIIFSARAMFHMQFIDFIQQLIRSKPCKKELRQRIVEALNALSPNAPV